MLSTRGNNINKMHWKEDNKWSMDGQVGYQDNSDNKQAYMIILVHKTLHEAFMLFIAIVFNPCKCNDQLYDSDIAFYSHMMS